ncbi:hypothetical protein COBT_000683 [Conglomerata obtusa]
MITCLTSLFRIYYELYVHNEYDILYNFIDMYAFLSSDIEKTFLTKQKHISPHKKFKKCIILDNASCEIEHFEIMHSLIKNILKSDNIENAIIICIKKDDYNFDECCNIRNLLLTSGKSDVFPKLTLFDLVIERIKGCLNCITHSYDMKNGGSKLLENQEFHVFGCVPNDLIIDNDPICNENTKFTIYLNFVGLNARILIKRVYVEQYETYFQNDAEKLQIVCEHDFVIQITLCYFAQYDFILSYHDFPKKFCFKNNMIRTQYISFFDQSLNLNKLLFKFSIEYSLGSTNHIVNAFFLKC